MSLETVLLSSWFVMWLVFTVLTTTIFVANVRYFRKDEPFLWVLVAVVTYQILTSVFIFKWLTQGC